MRHKQTDTSGGGSVGKRARAAPPLKQRRNMKMNMLELKRPLVFFDLETTGIDVVTDRIVQIDD